jgi:hypothetical protein
VSVFTNISISTYTIARREAAAAKDGIYSGVSRRPAVSTVRARDGVGKLAPAPARRPLVVTSGNRPYNRAATIANAKRVLHTSKYGRTGMCMG